MNSQLDDPRSVNLSAKKVNCPISSLSNDREKTHRNLPDITARQELIKVVL